jgi:RNA polymerase sigma factor (sigma-70 family)
MTAAAERSSDRLDDCDAILRVTEDGVLVAVDVVTGRVLSALPLQEVDRLTFEHARGLRLSQEVAEEAAFVAKYTLLRHADAGRHIRGCARAYAAGVAKYAICTARRTCRRSDKAAQPLQEQQLACGTAAPSSSEVNDLVARLLGLLSETERSVILAYYVGGRTLSQISQQVGFSVPTIHRMCRKALEIMKDGEGDGKAESVKNDSPAAADMGRGRSGPPNRAAMLPGGTPEVAVAPSQPAPVLGRPHFLSPHVKRTRLNGHLQGKSRPGRRGSGLTDLVKKEGSMFIQTASVLARINGTLMASDIGTIDGVSGAIGNGIDVIGNDIDATGEGIDINNGIGTIDERIDIANVIDRENGIDTIGKGIDINNGIDSIGNGIDTRRGNIDLAAVIHSGAAYTIGGADGAILARGKIDSMGRSNGLPVQITFESAISISPDALTKIESGSCTIIFGQIGIGSGHGAIARDIRIIGEATIIAGERTICASIAIANNGIISQPIINNDIIADGINDGPADAVASTESKQGVGAPQTPAGRRIPNAA